MELLDGRIDSHLTAQDTSWLAQYGMDWDVDPASQILLERLAGLGSQNLEIADANSGQEIIHAREQFFSTLGIEQEILDTLRVQCPTLISIDIFIETQRSMDILGLDIARVVNINPEMLMLTPELLQTKLDSLNALGLEAIKVVNILPAALSLAPSLVKATIEDLSAQGIDATKKPGSRVPIRRYPYEKIKAKLDDLASLGLNAHKIYRIQPGVLTYTIGSISAKLDNLTALGLNATQVANNFPAALCYAPESVKTKFDNLADLGLDPIKVICVNSSVLGFAVNGVKTKISGLKSLGLDATKIVNAHPTTLTYATESIKVRLDNLTTLGLNATNVINAAPTLISKALETIQTRLHVISHLCHTLQWEHTAEELVECFPAILSYSDKKLIVLARIAAKHLSVTERAVNPSGLKPMLITPLEQYIIALANNEMESLSAKKLRNFAVQNRKLSQSERREQALVYAPSLGKIGAGYLRYRSGNK